MADAKDILKLINKAAVDAVANSKPVNIEFGTVVTADDELLNTKLSIKISEKITLQKAQLIIPSKFNNDNIVQLQSFYVHGVTGEIIRTDISSYFLINTLKVGDKLALLRASGGQKYLVLDRVVE